MDNRTYIWGIPDIIFSGVLSAGLGAAIALFGTWLQGRKQAKLQTNQLSHDASEKAKEREMFLRRDVYLTAAEAIAKLQEYIKSYSDESLGEGDREAIVRNVWGTFNKIAIIGSIETMEVFDRIFLRFSELSNILALKHIESYQNRIENEEIEKNQKQLVAEIEQRWILRHSGTIAANTPEYDQLESEMQSLTDRIQKIFDEIRERRLAENEVRFDSAKVIGFAVAEMEVLMAEANIAIRKEFDLPIDEKRYLESVQSTYRSMQESLETTIEAFRQQLPDFIEKGEKKISE